MATEHQDINQPEDDLQDIRYGDLFSDEADIDDLEIERNTHDVFPKSRWYWFFFIASLLILFWAAAFTIYYTKKFPIAVVYLSLIDFGDYHLGYLSSFPSLDFAFGCIGLFLMWLAGRLFMGGYEIYIPRSARHALEFVIGLGLSGFALMCLTLIHLHYQVTVIALWVCLLTWLYFRMVWMQRKPPTIVHDELQMSNIDAEKGNRQDSARKNFQNSIIQPKGPMPNLFIAGAMALIILITLTTFWHALFYPETYWDSLILYLGWARKIFTYHHFPVKVVGQVGVGLGSNYPHLYEVHVAGIATIFNRWSEFYGRLIPPVCGIATLVLVYQTALYLTRSQVTAVATTLAVRVIPLGLAYNIWASNYCLAILFVAAFLYLAMVYIDTAHRPYLILLTLIVAFSMNINYLMGILWVAWFATVLIAHYRPNVWRVDENDGRRTLVFFEGARASSCVINAYQADPKRPDIVSILCKKQLWLLLLAGGLIGSVWYIRNWIVTGNPVYAFFYSIFGGRNVNPAVMESAKFEWLSNGDGIDRYVLDVYNKTDIYTKIQATWGYFVTQSQSWKLAPVWMAVVVPGMLIALVLPLIRRLIHTRTSTENIYIDQILSPTILRSGLLALVLIGLFLFYHYFISGIYLYQIICILPIFGVFITLVLHVASISRMRWAFLLLIIFFGFVPGWAYSLLGVKWTSEGDLFGQKIYPSSLWAFHRPMVDEETFNRLKWGDQVDMWNYINSDFKDHKILTHENRNLIYDESITLVHLDDWDMQKLYEMKDPAERARYIRSKDIQYYLYLPMEDNHRINKLAGMDELRDLGYLRKDYASGGMILYYISQDPSSDVDEESMNWDDRKNEKPDDEFAPEENEKMKIELK